MITRHRLAVVLSASVLWGCEIPQQEPASPDAGAAATPADDPVPDCVPQQPVEPMQHPDEDGFELGVGSPCNEACHGNNPPPGPALPAAIPATRTFSFAGTLYDAPRGGVGVPGATIRLVDARGAVLTMISKGNGSFWSETELVPPIQVSVSMCPDDRVMHAPIQTPTASCNSNGCHGYLDDRIHLDLSDR